MILVAITGSICSGKSFVGKIVEKLGYPVFYCDDEIHEILRERAILQKINSVFPGTVSLSPSSSRTRGSRNKQLHVGVHFNTDLATRGNYMFLGPRVREDDEGGEIALNKKLLAEIVFKDPKARQKLEDILYPKLFARQDRFIAKLKGTKSKIAFFEVPLLYEKKLESQYDYVIVTYAPKSILIKRAVERKIDQKIFSNILKSQIPSKDKENRADCTLNTNVQALELEKKIKKIVGEILKCHQEK